MPPETIEPTAPAEDKTSAAPAKPAVVKAEPKTARATLAEIAQSYSRDRSARQGDRSKLATMETELASLRAKQEASDRELGEYREFRQLAGKDKIAAAKRLGIDAKDLAETIVRDGTPDAKIAALDAELKAEKEARAKDREEQQAERQRRSAEEGREAALNRVYAAFDENAETWEALADVVTDDEGKVDQASIRREYMATYLLARHSEDPAIRAHADKFTDREILEATNARLEMLAERRLTGKSKRAGVTAAAPTPAPGKDKSGGSRRGKTLSNSLASEGASSWKPKNWDKLPDREQNKILAQRIEAGLPLD